jgi:ANTAR domain-containing protein/tannase/feruloyl esterase
VLWSRVPLSRVPLYQATPKPHPADVILPQISCAALVQHDFTNVPDAASRISSAADTSLNGTTYCEVKGYISPQTSFELLLPESTWQGDLVQEGCGGCSGAVNISAQPAVSAGCPQVAGNEFVLGTGDQGHQSPSGTDGTWAARDLALRTDVVGIFPGFAAVQALPMRLREQVIGALNLFRTTPGAFTPGTAASARPWADAATISLLHERSRRRSDTLSEQLQTALNSRVVIEQAKGKLAERLGTFSLLRQYARSRNLRLSDLAQAVIDGSQTITGLTASGRCGWPPRSSSGPTAW